MALGHNPSIVTSGLIQCIDAANPRSYPGTGTTLYDISGSGNDGALTNSPTYTSGTSGYFTFNGSNSSIIVANSSSLKSNTTSIECVFQNTGSLSGDVIQFGVGSGSYAQYYFRAVSGNMYWDWFPTNSSYYGEASVSLSSFPSGTWKHVVITGAADSTVTMYINGVSVGGPARIATGSVSTWTPANLTIGGYSWDGFTTSAFAYVRIYNVVLTSDQVNQNFNAVRGRYGI